jgi:phospholipid/cholesterol/gamma-HCH transport system substrate-binding protein
VLFVMQARGVFQPTQSLLLVADSAEGIAVGSRLTFSGFAIGRVVRIELGDDGKAHFHIEVPVSDARWLRTSSVFTLERGVVGGASLRAFTGVLEDPPLPDGARREVLTGDASAGVPQLVAGIQQLVVNFERLTAEQSALSASLDNLQKFSSALNGRHGALNALLGGDENARQVVEALQRTNALLGKADARLFGADGLVDKAELSVGELARLLGEARQSLSKADAILADARARAPRARSTARSRCSRSSRRSAWSPWWWAAAAWAVISTSRTPPPRVGACWPPPGRSAGWRTSGASPRCCRSPPTTSTA